MEKFPWQGVTRFVEILPRHNSQGALAGNPILPAGNPLLPASNTTPRQKPQQGVIGSKPKTTADIVQSTSMADHLSHPVSLVLLAYLA